MTIREAFQINVGNFDQGILSVHPKFIIHHKNCIGAEDEIQFICKDIRTAEDELEQLFVSYCMENEFDTNQVIKIICIDKEYSQIKKIAYAKYLLEWILFYKITKYDFNEMAERWHDEKFIDWDSTGSFLDYIMENGFSGKIWSSYHVFLSKEYSDRAFMKKILNPDEYTRYKKDMDCKLGGKHGK